MEMRKLNITVENANIKNDGKRIINRIKIDCKLKHYFKSNEFYAEYEKDVSDVPLGLLNIPALSSILHFAWAVGSDVTISELDETHLKGLEKVKKIFMDNPAYDFLSFEGELNVDKVSCNEFEKQKRQALLFSGGLDSMTSYISQKPEQLIMIWGLDVPTSWVDFWGQIKKTYEDLPITTIKSNTLELYDLGLVTKIGESNTAGYYAAFCYSLVTFGVCPPITVENVDNVMMASTFPIQYYLDSDYPFQCYKPHFFVDRQLGWANIETFDVENEYNRPMKIEKFIKPYFEEHGYSQIRTCGRLAFLNARKDKAKLNCSLCDKCQLLISLLSNYDMNPELCGFNINEVTFPSIKNNIVDKRWPAQERQKYFWGELKKHINDNIENDYCGSKEFLSWLKTYEL